MKLDDFILKWSGSQRSERAASQEHFIDLCSVLGVDPPNSDPTGEEYAFEKGAKKNTGGDGFADVWKRGCFAWEYKKKRSNLDDAYQQLLRYREALESPPLLVVCDLNRFVVRTNFTGTKTDRFEFDLKQLGKESKKWLPLLKAVFRDAESLRPRLTRARLTAEAAEAFAKLAERLEEKGHERQLVARFLHRILFCMFAQDSGLLPPAMIQQLCGNTRYTPWDFTAQLSLLFETMSHEGGMFGPVRIDWFNGGLFNGGETLPLTTVEVDIIRDAAGLPWKDIEPAIFGTLFERALNSALRSQLGAHYTDRESIQRLIEPVIVEPLRKEFENVKVRVSDLLAAANGKGGKAKKAAAQAAFDHFLERLRSHKVLDPACGSGNFLYIALQALKTLEREALNWESETFGSTRRHFEVGPSSLLGIEKDPYAAELARVTIWIGQIQWMLENDGAYDSKPILQPLDNIRGGDGILDLSDPEIPKEAAWPEADVIVSNPPFLGGKLLRSNLGDEYVDSLFEAYDGVVPKEADLVAYWFEKARVAVESGKTKRVGLLATQGIRGGANRKVLQRIKETGSIYEAWSDRPWVLDGAAVHVSFVMFDDGTIGSRRLDGQPVEEIHANLTCGEDLTKAVRLNENMGLAFMGDTKGGAFDIPEELALEMLARPNPNGRSNRDVLRPWMNGSDVTGRSRRMWIIDFGTDMCEEEAALYEAPFEFLKTPQPKRNKSKKPASVEEERRANKRASYAEKWWLHVEPRPAMRQALSGLKRYIATPRVAKHRLFAWLPAEILPDSQLIVVAREDDFSFGVLHSSPHEQWARRMGTQLREAESGFRYTPTTTFETFPFPRPTDSQRKAIADAARDLHEKRSAWLDPDGMPEDQLKGRTLTNLYNENPTWLQHCHERLDKAVLRAYGWPEDLDGEPLIAKLLALNLERAAEETAAK